MADEDAIIEEAMGNLKEAGQRIRATQTLMRSQDMTEGENYHDILTRLSTALAMAATGDSTLDMPPKPRLAKPMREPLAFERWRGTVGGS
jgi:hypothetical protein